MAQLIADRRDVDFVLYEQIGLSKAKRFKEFDKKMVDLIVSEARTLAIKEILPTFKPGDEEGCTFENGEVKVPECFKKVYELYKEGEWLAMCDDPKYGGQGMPRLVGLAVSDYLIGANPSFMLYPGLTHGTAKMIEKLGTEEQKKIYLKNLYNGNWAGTMLLTEANAGSDLGALETTAKKNSDGTYSITGEKIFISGGEQDLTDNIIHPVLARIEGAPAGSKGISMFIVPKFHINEDGSKGERNGIFCSGIEEKMGIHGSSTCTMTLGSKIECKGTLLGKENEGLKGMFLMMNESRHFVGFQGFSAATASYMHSLNYARERVQGKTLLGEKTIIGHPDVRRQLILMKTYVEGARSLLYYNANLFDSIKTSDDDEEKIRLNNLIEVLTPIVKGYVTDKALEVTSHGVQIFGGYGYTKEFPVEQLMRDARIFMIYEGTNGIQSLDFMGRKLTMQKGKAFNDFINEISSAFERIKKTKQIENIVNKAEVVFLHAKDSVELMIERLTKKDIAAFLSSYTFMEVFGDIVMSWMLLWRAEKAAQALDSAKSKDKDFYEGQIQTADFFVNSMLPITVGKINSMKSVSLAPTTMKDAAFGSK